MLRELAEPWAGGEGIKSILNRISPLAKLKYSRAYEIWYGRARKVEDYEIDAIKEALRIKNRKSARNELHELKLRIANLEARLALRDADFHQPDIEFARHAAGGFGRMGDQR